MHRKLKVVLLLTCILVSLVAKGQDFTRNNWYFSGDNQALIFGKGPAARSTLSPGKVPQNNIGEKVTATDPTSGDLIFYSDGINIYDATNQIMQNGNGILTDPNGIQAMSTSPVPGAGNENLYYLFHKNAAGEIRYTVIDRSVQGNRTDGPPAGEVISIGRNIASGITSRGNGMITIGSRDMTEFWLVSQNASSGAIEIHSIPEPNGTFTMVDDLTLTTPIEALHFAYHQLSGQIAIVPSNNSNIQIIRFTETGQSIDFERILLNTFIPGNTFGGSAGWSATGQYLYFSRNTATNGNVYRFNMHDIRDDAPLDTLLNNPVDESMSLLLAPDSTIYHIYRDTPGGSRFLARVNEPDSAIALVDYESALFNGTDVNSNYFSQFSPEADITPLVTAVLPAGDLCMNNPVQFFPMIEPSTAIPTEYFWEFQPFGLTSTEQAPIMSFEEAGLLSATLSVTINGETVRSNTVMRQILENDLQVQLPDTTICEGETLELNAEPEQGGQGQQGGASGGPFEYLWSTGETTSTINVTEAGDYWVVITPTTGCPIYAEAQVDVYADESTTANIWYFGDGAGIDFNEEDGLDPPPRSITTPHAMNAPAGTSTISDANGDVLFYTNGSRVWNRENNVMPNGTEIGGDSTSTQAVIIVPFVDDDTQYYLFTTKEVYGDNTFEVKFSVVDMKEDNGRGDVVIKDQILFTRSTEKIVALDGGGGSWLLVHEYGNNTFRTYPITGAGIGAPIISSAGAVHSFNDPLSGQAGMKFSADGERVAVALIEGTEDYVELFDFDPILGEIVDFEYRIDLNEGGGGNDEVYDVHFSQGGAKLFVTMNNRNTGAPGGRVLEYRVDSLSTPATRLASKADISDGLNMNVNFGQMQTGPDGQIYMAVETPGNPAGSAFVSSIAAIDDTLFVSPLNPQAVLLTTGNSRLGLPNFVQNNANPQMDPSMSAPDLTCTEERIEMTSSGTSDIDEFLWSITNQADNSTVFSAVGMDTAYTFPQGQSGLFNISVNIFNRCGFDTTIVQEIQVLDIPAPPTVPQAISVCEGDTAPLDAIMGQPDDPNLIFEWTNSQGAVVSTTRNFVVTQPEIYTVTITNIAGCSSSAEIFAGPPFEIDLPDDAIVCQDAELILDSNVTANNYIWTVINPGGGITGPLDNDRRATVDTSVPGLYTYVVSIEDPITPGCFVNDSTRVTVNPIAQATLGTVVNATCGSSDGSFEFALTTTGNYSYVVTGNASGTVGQGNNLTGPGIETITGLGPDVYSVLITDNSSGCTNTLDGIEVQNDGAGFTIANVAVTNADCINATGDMTVTLSADVFPITYTLTNTADGTSITRGAATALPTTTFDFQITGLAGSTYDLAVVAGGCTQTQAGIVVDTPLPVDLTTEPFVEICGASAPLTASSATASATFSWTGPNGFTDTGANINAPESGTYTVTASAPGSCDVTETVVVDLTVQPIIQINEVGDVCTGEITLQAEVTNPEAGTTYVYNWDTGANTQSITVNTSGTYNVTVRPADNLTCTETASIVITIPEEIEATVSSTPACNDGSTITLTVDVLTGNPNSFTWTRDGQAISQSGPVINITDPDGQGSYTVRISDGTCFIERSIEVRRQTVPPGILPDVGLYCPTRAIQETLLAGRGFETYVWTRDGVPFPDAGQTLTIPGPGLFEVTMTTATGCVQVDQVRVIESCDPRVVAPNAFAPTSNPPNNVFSVVPNDFVDNFEIFIYSRWGELIFQSTTLEFQWNGVFNGEVVPLGTYPYIMRFTSRFEPERGTFEQSGAVTVVR